MSEQFETFDWGEFYNPLSKSIMVKRILIDKLCQDSKEIRDKVLLRCKEDPIYWIDNFVWTADPRNLDIGKPTLTPFQCFPKQAEYILWRRYLRENGLSGYLLKSRDSGASWLNVSDQVHAWLFEPGFSGILSSRKEMFVDSLGNMDSLFEKARFIIKMLPPWMRPAENKIVDNYCKLINKTNGTRIIGEAGEEIGRAGRVTIADVDEAAYIRSLEKAARSLSQTTRCIIFTSTPQGKANHYGKNYLEFAGDEKKKKQTFIIKWQDDPRKSDKWYQHMCDQWDKLTIAREVDASFEESSEDTLFNYLYLMESVKAFATNTGYHSRVTAGLDVAGRGANKSVFSLMIDGCSLELQIEINEIDVTQIAIEAHKLCVAYHVDTIAVDVVQIGEGVVSTLISIPDRRYKIIPFRGNLKCTSYYYEEKNATAKELYKNLKADLAHQLALKVRRTFEFKKGIRSYDRSQLLSINSESRSKLMAQMETVEVVKRDDNLIRMMTKNEMKEQGIKSPDYFDSLMLAYAAVVMDESFESY